MSSKNKKADRSFFVNLAFFDFLRKLNIFFGYAPYFILYIYTFFNNYELTYNVLYRNRLKTGTEKILVITSVNCDCD